MPSIARNVQMTLPIEGCAAVATKKCNRCGITKPTTEFYIYARSVSGKCKTCERPERRARDKKRYEEHKQELNRRARVRPRSYYEQKRLYYLTNREVILEKNSERRAQKRQDDPTYIQRQNRRYNAEHPDKIAECHARRRARLVGAAGTHTTVEWQALKAIYDCRCLSCGRQEPEICLTKDHVIPLAKGGSDDISNIQPLCKNCNSHKRVGVVDYRPQVPIAQDLGL